MQHNRFEAYELSLEMARVLGPSLRLLATRNRDLADQLKRATASAVSCLAEGRRRVGKDRLHLFRTAEGSAAEVQAQLQLAVAFGDLPGATLTEAIAMADRLTGMCYGLTRDRQRGG